MPDGEELAGRGVPAGGEVANALDGVLADLPPPQFFAFARTRPRRAEIIGAQVAQGREEVVRAEQPLLERHHHGGLSVAAALRDRADTGVKPAEGPVEFFVDRVELDVERQRFRRGLRVSTFGRKARHTDACE